MIDFIFTIDYEVYGNCEGGLAELVLEPAEKLKGIFAARQARFVTFVEVAELMMIEAHQADPAIDGVREQLRDLHARGFELGLHLHPQWLNARYEGGVWDPDYGEYNLCTLPPERISEILDGSISYLRTLLDAPGFTPLSFRAGNWLFQPTQPVGGLLMERGIKIDSSVFKGGRLRRFDLDYRRALKNGYCWPFSSDVNVQDPQGSLWEFPIYSRMIPTWKLFTAKRLEIHRRGQAVSGSKKGRISRFRDLLRPRFPLKLDFCRLTMGQIRDLLGQEIREDRKNPDVFRPIVAIGHTKDLTDFGTVELLLSFLSENGLRVSQFADVYGRLPGADGR